MDVLALQERIEKTIALGESQFREFKSAYQGAPGLKKPRDVASVTKDIGEALVAFANADGGELLVGVEDDGDITGVPYSDDRVRVLLDAPRTAIHHETPLPKPLALKLDFQQARLLYFAVEKSTTEIHQTSDGRCLQRRDLESIPVSATKLQFERNEQLSRQYDRTFIDNATVSDLSRDLITDVSEHTARMSVEKSLQYLGLAEYGLGALKLRRAALLLFAEDVSRWHPRCQVRIVRIRGSELKTGRDYNVASDETITDNILRLLSCAWDQLRPHLVETKLSVDALFREQVMYPEDACREALINAITHRDYSMEGKNIEILIFDDRMEVRSPGQLLSTIRLDDLRKQKGVHESRNALVARVLREIGYVREMGEGMRRIFRLMKDADLVPPALDSSNEGFSINLFHRSVFSPADQAWLSGYRQVRLTREEMLVAMHGKDGRLLSPKQIYDVLDLHDWDVYRAVFEQLSWKEVIYNTMSEAEKNRIWKSKGISKRQIPRLAIRQPEEIEAGLSELFAVIANAPGDNTVGGDYIRQILDTLPSTNIYKSNPYKLTQLFRIWRLAPKLS